MQSVYTKKVPLNLGNHTDQNKLLREYLKLGVKLESLEIIQEQANQLEAQLDQLAKANLHLILDLDDTLIVNHTLYRASSQAIAEYVFEHSAGNYSLESIVDIHSQFDRDLMSRYGTTPDRWYHAAELTAQHVFERPLNGHELRAVHSRARRAMGVGIAYPDTHFVLALLRTAGSRLILKTKGVPEVQGEKIFHHRFHEVLDGIAIVPAKTQLTMQNISATYGLEKPWVIGDSPASDILPALDAGYQSVLVRYHNTVWAAEQSLDTRLGDVYQANCLAGAILHAIQ